MPCPGANSGYHLICIAAPRGLPTASGRGLGRHYQSWGMQKVLVVAYPARQSAAWKSWGASGHSYQQFRSQYTLDSSLCMSSECISWPWYLMPLPLPEEASEDADGTMTPPCCIQHSVPPVQNAFATLILEVFYHQAQAAVQSHFAAGARSQSPSREGSCLCIRKGPPILGVAPAQMPQA